MKSVDANPQTFMGFEGDRAHEINILREGKVEEFKNIFKKHDDTINGFKSPGVLFSRKFMRNMVVHFQHTDFIISTRHPILHFQSLYNYKFRSKIFKGKKRPNPLTLIGRCSPPYQSVCTDRALFHDGLARLMLTPKNITDELDLLNHPNLSQYPAFKGRVFLTELGQLADVNETRAADFRRGIEDFLGLTPNSFDLVKRHSNRTKEIYLDICKENYQRLREELLLIGQRSSKWILNYFMKSPRVVVANREHLVELFEKWQTDPCLM